MYILNNCGNWLIISKTKNLKEYKFHLSVEFFARVEPVLRRKLIDWLVINSGI